MLVDEAKSFRELCQENGIAVTDQRQALFDAMKTMHGHPSLERSTHKSRRGFRRSRWQPSTKTYIYSSGVFREVSMHHCSSRAEMNDESHHHLVCSKCKAVTDIGEKELGLVSKYDKLPSGFLVERYAVDVVGICAKCQQA